MQAFFFIVAKFTKRDSTKTKASPIKSFSTFTLAESWPTCIARFTILYFIKQYNSFEIRSIKRILFTVLCTFDKV